jgi:WD40-like Beta Propeller Repeat
VTDIDNAPESDEMPSWSPDGTKIAFARRNCPPSMSGYCTPFEIYVMNADGTNRVAVTNDGLNNDDPSWSPDGGKIAFVSNRSGNPEIYVMNADGTSQDQLTSLGGRDPAWSPDGIKIAFSNAGDLYTMSSDGADVTPIVNDEVGEDLQPAWSPDGSRVAFVHRTSYYVRPYGWEWDDIDSVNPDGTGRSAITTDGCCGSAGDGYRNTAPAYSPDGTKIAFERAHCYVEGDCDTADDIFVMNSDGTGINDVTNSPATYDRDPDWQPIPLNEPPDCSSVTASRQALTTANRRFVAITLDGVTDPDGDAVTVSVNGVTQDEPVESSGDATSPDAIDDGDGQIRIRAERDPRGDGRVYRIAFTATDGRGGSCSSTATVSVLRKKHRAAVDSAPPSYDSYARR